MRSHEPLAIVLHERQQVGALLGRELDLADAEKEDRIEVVEVADVELFAARDAGSGGKRDRMLGDQLQGIGADAKVS